MRRRLTAPLSLIVLSTGLLLWLVAVPLVSAGDPCYHGFSMPSGTTGSGPEIRLEPCAFSPTVTNVDVGASVKFVNGGEFTHLITGANQAWGSRDVEIQPGKTASYTFDQAGVYPYACALHRGMSGVIVVGDGTAAAAVGAGSGTTSGTTTGTTTGTAASAPTAATQATQVDGRLLLVAAFGGAVLGGLVAWAVLRRSSSRAKETVSGVA